MKEDFISCYHEPEKRKPKKKKKEKEKAITQLTLILPIQSLLLNLWNVSFFFQKGCKAVHFDWLFFKPSLILLKF